MLGDFSSYLKIKHLFIWHVYQASNQDEKIILNELKACVQFIHITIQAHSTEC